MDVYEELLRLCKLGQKCAIATIVQVRGSIPSYESAKLLVREDGSMIGTIGGGCVEAEVWNAAREVIEKEQPRHLSAAASFCLSPNRTTGTTALPARYTSLSSFPALRPAATSRRCSQVGRRVPSSYMLTA